MTSMDVAAAGRGGISGAPSARLRRGLIGTTLARLGAAWAAHRAFRETCAALDRLSAHVLRDIGLCRQDIDRIAREAGAAAARASLRCG